MRRAIGRIPGTRDTLRFAQRVARSPKWFVEPKRWISSWRMGAYYNRHKGKRAFIIGNGPSLNQMDLSLLKNEYTFGANRIYLLFPRAGFQATYLCCVNPTVTEQFGAELSAQPMPKFLGWRCKDHVPFTSDTILLAPPSRTPSFSVKPTHTLWEGATVTYVAMQLAFYMGFSEVILIGVDHNFVDKGDPHTKIVSQADDANHFDPNYWGKGVAWNLPDLETSETAYAVAKAQYAAHGRRIVDATVGGKLTVFPKVDYASLF
jgi:hypothetical protein